MTTLKIKAGPHSLTHRLFALFAAVIVATILGLFGSSGTAIASERCQKVRANEVASFTSPTTVEGTITRGGILNGTSLSVITSGLMPTPDPNVFSFTIAKSFTTHRGTLQTYSPHLLDVSDGTGSAFARVDPDASTGIFAGATGLLFINFTRNDDGTTATSSITGEICFAD